MVLVSTKYLTDLMAKNLSRKPIYFSVNINLLRFLANIFNKEVFSIKFSLTLKLIILV